MGEINSKTKIDEQELSSRNKQKTPSDAQKSVSSVITHKIAQEKKDVVNKIVQSIKQYPIIGVVNMENLPTAQLQRMRHQLRGKIDLFMTKISLIKLALEQGKTLKKGLEGLDPYVKGMPAFLFTKENPFILFKTLKKSKSPAPAKPGQNAPRDITVSAGPTPFAPGPVISEFAALGIKAGVEGAKVAIKQDAVVCKEGKPISAPLASMLARLGIEPMEVGLDLVAVYENGTIYPKSVLDIDEKVFYEKLTTAAAEAFNLAVDIALPLKETTEVLVQKAFREAKTLALEANILADAVVAELVEKAEREMLALKTAAHIPDSAPVTKEEKKEEQVKEQPKEVVEPKKETPKQEPVKEQLKPAPKPVFEPKPKKEPIKEQTVQKEVQPKKEQPQPASPLPAPQQSKELEKKPQPQLPDTVTKIVTDLKKHETPQQSAEKIVEDVKKQTTQQELDEQKRKKEIEQVEALAKKLVKKGTLR